MTPQLDIASLARQSGATAEDGGKAEAVFCFTEQEMVGFAQRLTQELCSQARHHLGRDGEMALKTLMGLR